MLNPELLRPDGPQRFVHPNRSNYNAAGQVCAAHAFFYAVLGSISICSGTDRGLSRSEFILKQSIQQLDAPWALQMPTNTYKHTPELLCDTLFGCNRSEPLRHAPPPAGSATSAHACWLG